jgi:7-cyano-7-deazaguanine reductase
MADNPLGKQVDYPQQYDPSQLFPVARTDNRAAIGLSSDNLPFQGYDHWRAYELSWLSPSGLPVVATANIFVPCDSPNIVESKSMKLYFNSLNQSTFANMEAVRATIATDLSQAAGASVAVDLFTADGEVLNTALMPEQAVLLDTLDVDASVWHPDAGLLKASINRSEEGSFTTDHNAVGSDSVVEEWVYSHLFRSNCPITRQPDWGSILIHYRGEGISHSALLRYIVSYRQHEGFHEHCVEQIFNDLINAFNLDSLTVSINYLRRGGIEINPIRSTEPTDTIKLPRLIRQ